MTPTLLANAPRPAAPTTYPPLPWCPPRAAAESAEAYGLRALLFVTAERLAATVDTEGLQLAAHCFRVAVSNPEILPNAAERLADVLRIITGTLAAREAWAREQAAQALQAPAQASSADQPNTGPMAPLVPPPVRPTPPAGAQPLPVPQPVPSVPATVPAAPRAAFVPPARPVLRPSAPVAPAVSAADWGF